MLTRIKERSVLASWAAVWLLSASLLAGLIGLQRDAAALLKQDEPAEAPRAAADQPSVAPGQRYHASQGPDGTAAGPQQPAPPAYATDRIVVKYEEVEQCVHCLLKNRGAFKDATADRSDSLDVLHTRFGVTAAKPVFRTETEEARLPRGRGNVVAVAALRQHHRDRIEQVKRKFSRRTQRAPKNAAIPDLHHVYVLTVPEGTNIEEAVAAFSADPHVEYAQPDYLVEANWVPNDPYYSSSNSWGQGYDDLWGLKKIHAAEAWDITKGEGIVVAVIDTGLDYYHPDIIENVWANPGEIAGNGLDDDGNGYVDDIRGWDFTTCAYFGSNSCVEFKEADDNPMDGHGHGTHVAGTLAGVGNNAVGVIGVSPRSVIMPLKFLNDKQGSGSTSWAATATIYAVMSGAEVLNNSWGCSQSCPSNPTIEEAIQTAYGLGAIVVFAAGNSNRDVANFSPQNMPEVITVAATDVYDNKATFSNWGEGVCVAAPGTDILSLRARDTDLYTGRTKVVAREFYRASGTSMAAPHVSGGIALALSMDPTLSPTAVRSLIETYVDPMTTSVPLGTGRINVMNVVTHLSTTEHIAITRIVQETTGTAIYGMIHINAMAGYYLAWKAVGASTWVDVSSQLPFPRLHEEFLLTVLPYTTLPTGNIVVRLRVWTGSVDYEDQRGYLLEKAKLIDLEDENGEWSAYGSGSTYYVRGTLLGASQYAIEYAAAGTDDWQRNGVSLLAPPGAVVQLQRLAALDTASIGPPGEYTLRLVGEFNGRVEESRFNFRTEEAEWITTLPITISNQQPLIADLQGDGMTEILLGSTGKWGAARGLYVVRQDGTVDAGLSRSDLGIPCALAAHNIDGVGGDEVLAVAENSSSLSTLHLLTYDSGRLIDLPGWPLILPNGSYFYYGDYFPVPFLEDLDGDGIREIITVIWQFSFSGPPYYYFAIYKLNGQPVSAAYPLLLPHRGTCACSPVPDNLIDMVPIDLDSDGRKEVVIATQQSPSADVYLRAYHPDGSQYLTETWPVNVGLLNQASPLYKTDLIPYDIEVGDVNGDGQEDLVFINHLGEIYAIGKDGRLLNSGWPQRYKTDFYMGSETMALANVVDDDNNVEVVLGYDKYLHVYETDGQELPGYPVDISQFFPTDSLFQRIETPIVGDIDGDGGQDIIGMVQLSNTGYSDVKKLVLVFNLDGTIQRSWKLYGNLSDVFKIPGAVITDSDNDGAVDVIAANTIYDTFETWLFHWKLNAGYDPSNLKWPMFKHNKQRTGRYNHAPQIISPSDQSVSEGQLLSFSVSATDTNGDFITYNVGGLPAGATFSGQTFSWTPDHTQAGEHRITFTASDGELEDSETITITVTNVPLTVSSLTDAPDPFYPNAGQSTTISFTLSEPASVTLKLYTSAGSLIGTYLYNELKPQGTSTVIWDGLSRGTPYPNGTYPYKLWSTDAAGTRHQPPYPATGTITIKSLTTPGGGNPTPCTSTTTDPDLASAKPCSSQEQ